MRSLKMRKPAWLAAIVYCDVSMRPPIDRSQSPETGFLLFPLIQTSFVNIPSIELNKRDVFNKVI